MGLKDGSTKIKIQHKNNKNDHQSNKLFILKMLEGSAKRAEKERERLSGSIQPVP